MRKKGGGRRGSSWRRGSRRSQDDGRSNLNDEHSPRTPPTRQASEAEDNVSYDSEWQRYPLPESSEAEEENPINTENDNPPINTRSGANQCTETAESEEENGAHTEIENPPTTRRRGANRGTDIRPDSLRIRINVKHRRFLEPPVSRDITATMKSFLNGRHSTCGDVPDDKKKALWKKFKTKFKWSPKKTAEVRKTFEKTSEERLKGMFERARRRARSASKSGDPNDWKAYRPPWLSEEHWTELCEQKWGDPDYQKKCEIARKNRMTKKGSTISKHTGGSIPFVAHEKRLEEKLKRKVRGGELFAHTHKHNQGTGDYVDDKSKDVIDEHL